jgi:hypothetical protein
MNNNLRSLSYVILFASLSTVSALGVIGFLNNAYADNTNMSETMGMNATVTTNATMTGNMAGNSTVSPPPMQKMLPPLEQFKSGTPAKTIQCGEGLSLVIKIEDGSPACVSPTIAQVLVARAWGTMP